MITDLAISALILGVVLGFLFAWMWFIVRARRAYGILEGRAASAEAVVNELRQQTGLKTQEIARLGNELSVAKEARVESLAKLEASRKNLEEQRQLLEDAKKTMTDTFSALASATLKSSSADFLRLASEHLGKAMETTKGRLGEHQTAMDGMIKPLHEMLKRYEEQIKVMEDGRLKAYGGLEEQLRTLVVTHENLQKETNNLVSALRKPQVRGRWGEMQLKRVAELSGMSLYCDFSEQVSVDTENGRIRPDMVIHLPSDREIVVDSKVPLDAYLDAVAVQSEEDKKARIERHARQVRAHVNKLSSKEYWNQFAKSPEFVILFIPGESFLAAALDVDATLIEDGIQKGVIIATPTTFIALLRAIAYGWRQERVAKNAVEISVLAKELYERMSTMVRHFEELGSALRKATDAYNRAVGSMEARVLPSIRKFKDLGVSAASEISTLEQIDRTPRSIDADMTDDGHPT